ncbi:tyrosine protein kinase [Parabacteroides sp. 52]|uniref:GumC family protein n=1 Tax=unclassified Parabacteroides TaxID=2649774 RepID=UPI0013D3CB71|nr:MULTISPECIES: Wzz/FepE/Etk N-terminal domain-containing protein [unclassified Parabacteroides]MDH6534542.1 tyrosine-protein kinase Etk/Wzc [Parabacteroides sp. PM5-20]NDV55222.1 tyrosine protein kinase [Parabacteroides sp. 52]
MNKIETTPAHEEKETIGLKEIFVGYLHHWKVFVAAGITSLLLAVLYLTLVPNTFEVMARVQLQADEGSSGSFGLGEAAGLMKSFGLGGGSSSTVNVDDEKTILASNELMGQVIKELGLQVEYKKPNSFLYTLYTDAPLSLTFNEETNANILDDIEFTISIASDGKAKVNVKDEGEKRTFEYASLPATISLQEGDFVLNYKEGAEKQNKPYKIKAKVKPLNWVAEQYVGAILIDEVSKSSNILELSCQDHQKRRGVDLLNTLMRKFNEHHEKVKQEEAAKSMFFVKGRIDHLLGELDQTERVLEEFKLKHNMTDIQYDVEFYVGQMQELQVKIIEAEAQVHVINMMSEFVENPANKYNIVPILLTAQDGESGGGPISMYNQKLIERNQILKASRPESPLIQSTNAQLDKLREGVVQTIANAKNSLALTVNELKNKENKLYSKMGEVPTLEREYTNYKRQQEILQGVYLILLQKREEIALTVGDMKDRARVIDQAFVKKKRVAPRKLFALLGMMLFTLVAPIVWIESKKIFVELKKEYKRTA